ncbi:MAG: type II toxin-antitoxin system VapC family toxin [Thermoleophilia bacterium]|nr:type II toxin-antitoxin system VapC family toxin [Thermoleophilia bacterium]
MIVADTNLVSYLLIDGDRTEAARRVWARDPEWILPTLWRSEFLNVLATMVRLGHLEARDATSVWRRALSLVSRSETEPEGERVLGTAIEHGISACDAQFVAVAEVLEAPLVTCDRALAAACSHVAVEAERFGRRTGT